LHIIRDLDKGIFSLKQFYLRRMRRILPVLLVVLFVTSVAAYILLLSPEFKNYSGSLLATLLSVSNLYFWVAIHVGYFATDATTVPLQHTWSLGVEEQYYLLWPLMLVGIYKLSAKRHLLLIAYLLCITSFPLYYFCRIHVRFTYYSPVTRAFELLLGAILAMPYRPVSLLNNYKIKQLLSIMNVGLIIYASFFVLAESYPGFNALLPCLGASLIIFTGKETECIGNQLLANPILVFIGLISYSLYLWHWPIISFLNILGFELTLYFQLIVVTVSIVLSYFSWKYIEQHLIIILVLIMCLAM